MAFISMLFATFAVISVILLAATGIAVLFYVIAAMVAMIERRKAKKQAVVYKRPVSVLVLRIIGTIFMLPLIITVGFIVYVTISVKVDNYNNLGYAVQTNNVQEAERLLKKGIDPDCGINSKKHVQDGEDTILLSVVADSEEYEDGRERDEQDRLAMAKLLIRYGADVNAVHAPESCDSFHTYEKETDQYALDDTCGFTPLMYAVENGELDMVKLLVENGADIDVIDKCGFNVICVAADNYWDSPENLQIITYLMDQGADADVVTNFRQDAPFLAYRHTTYGERENREIWEKLSEYNSTSPYAVQNHEDDLVE